MSQAFAHRKQAHGEATDEHGQSDQDESEANNLLLEVG
jgi:hypothetical protein